MGDSNKSLLGILGVIFVVVGLAFGHYHDPLAAAAAGSVEDDEVDSQPGGFSVVSGPIEDDLSESWPWAHHTDFDERFPGEDQIAEESEAQEPQTERPRQSRPQWEQRLPPMDDLIIPDFARMFSEGPQIGSPTVRPQNNSTPLTPQPSESIGSYDHPWWDLFGLSTNVWWKGPNVCVKREEDEESQSGEESNDSSHSFKVQFSMCSQQNTRFVCATRQQNRDTKKLVTVRSEYECCQGFTLDARKTQCIRGGHEDILKTIEQMGGTEFLEFIRMTGLESKLQTQNLTVFVPSNAALIPYRRLQYIREILSKPPDFPPEFRERRSILMHTRNEAGGRNVRRRGGESKGRRAMMIEDDQYPTDISSSSEEEGEQETNDVVRIPLVKRRDPTLRNGKSNEIKQPSTNFPMPGMPGTSNEELKQMLLNQMLAGKLSTDDFIDEKVVFSENVNEQANEIETLDPSLHESHSYREPSQGSVLRLNTWFLNSMGQMYTVNCVPLTSMDNKCSNGMVHIVSDVFQPATKSIGEILANAPQFSIFRSYLHAAGLLPMLEKSDGHLTLLAPSNDAFESMDPSILSRMRAGDSCLKKILRRHILPITLCSAVIQKGAGKLKVRNIDLDIMEIENDKDGKMFINGSQFILKDSMATNGVIHSVNKVIVSDNDKKLSEILARDGFNYFVTFAFKVGIKLDEMENITVFAPSDAAIQRNFDIQTLIESTRLREQLMFHIATPETSRCSLTEKTTLPSSIPGRSLIVDSVTVPQAPYFLPFSAEKTTVQCARIEGKSGRGCNGRYYEINQFLVPPTLSVFGVIQASPEFSIFTRLLIETLDETSLELLGSGNETLTIFAPTDEAFSAIRKSELQKLKTDKPYAVKVINRHIFRDVICCSEVYEEHKLFSRMLTTLNGSVVLSPVSRNADGSVRYGRGDITHCDSMGWNGVVQTVNTVYVDDAPTENGRSCRNCNQPQPQTQFSFLNLFGR